MAITIADTPLAGQSNGGGGSTLSFSYTNTTGTVMCLFATMSNGHLLNTPTLNGSSTGVALLTNLLSDAGNANSYRDYVYLITNPPTGTVAVAFAESLGGTCQIDAAVYCFKGGDTATQPDNSFTTGRTTATTMDATGTTLLDGAWPVAFCTQNGAPVGAGSGATREVYTSGSGENGIFDNAGVLTPAGTSTIHTTLSGGVAASYIWFAIKPPGGGPGPNDLHVLSGEPMIGSSLF